MVYRHTKNIATFPILKLYCAAQFCGLLCWDGIDNLQQGSKMKICFYKNYFSRKEPFANFKYRYRSVCDILSTKGVYKLWLYVFRTVVYFSAMSRQFCCIYDRRPRMGGGGSMSMNWKYAMSATCILMLKWLYISITLIGMYILAMTRHVKWTDSRDFRTRRCF
jgi:hypothetical protein